MKALKVISVSAQGWEMTINHPLVSTKNEERLIVATLQGVIQAGHAIKSFELVEA